MSGTGGLFSHFPYYHARELPAPPFLPRPFRVEHVVAVAAHLAPRAGLAHLELLLRQFPSAILTHHSSGKIDACSPSGRGTPNSAATSPPAY